MTKSRWFERTPPIKPKIVRPQHKSLSTQKITKVYYHIHVMRGSGKMSCTYVTKNAIFRCDVNGALCSQFKRHLVKFFKYKRQVNWSLTVRRRQFLGRRKNRPHRSLKYTYEWISKTPSTDTVVGSNFRSQQIYLKA